jgi:hypothetical protein
LTIPQKIETEIALYVELSSKKTMFNRYAGLDGKEKNEND